MYRRCCPSGWSVVDCSPLSLDAAQVHDFHRVLQKDVRQNLLHALPRIGLAQERMLHRREGELSVSQFKNILCADDTSRSSAAVARSLGSMMRHREMKSLKSFVHCAGFLKGLG